ncbi:unnamed protein product [[Candida] boidinii]|uniref:Unnamed protein product n=1 Tax=Candida boidinii TaxID=5477 RepID=A0A9W6T3S1_CANBO|nr:hypothetical protein BVG19_g2177 [[Candida] boidinii]OWB50748.1 hypothetical protein B5S27_g2300 [[Candida] boidinii]OWB65313.1 hypothetical protein B5S30_g637 [[Candida] boidinii]OWB85906.1 hypothetical protein B5S33_g4581 [[Candida] boidinii]GME73727.1 unnamed protein product [[Candida] boidinii]
MLLSYTNLALKRNLVPLVLKPTIGVRLLSTTTVTQRWFCKGGRKNDYYYNRHLNNSNHYSTANNNNIGQSTSSASNSASEAGAGTAPPNTFTRARSYASGGGPWGPGGPWGLSGPWGPGGPWGYRRRRRGRFFKFFIFFLIIGGLISYKKSTHEWVDHFSSDELPKNEIELMDYKIKLENDLNHLKIVKSLKNDPNFIILRSWDSFDKINEFSMNNGDISHELSLSNDINSVKSNTSKPADLHNTLNTPGGIFIPPMIFHNPVTKETITIVHLGKKLTGYPFLVHGGILGLTIDEVFKKSCSLDNDNFDKNKIHTKNLTINYLFPSLANRFLVFKCKAYEKDSVKNEQLLVGSVETQSGKKLVKSSAIFTFENENSANEAGSNSSSPIPETSTTVITSEKRTPWFWSRHN